MIKILVVDDDTIVRKFMMKLVINKFGYDFLQAANGVEALRILEQNKPDIIFLDISMPVMDGIEFLKAIRKQHKYKNLPVIAITSHSDKTTVKQLIEIGIQEYILKPLSYNETYARLREILSYHKSAIIANQLKEYKSKKNSKVKSKLMINDSDTEFTQYLKTFIEHKFDIILCNSSAEALDLFVENKPEYFLSYIDSDPSNNSFIVNKLKELDDENTLKFVGLTYKNIAPNEYFPQVIGLSYNRNLLLPQLADILLNHTSVSESLNCFLDNYIKGKLRLRLKRLFNNYCESGINFTDSKQDAELTESVTKKINIKDADTNVYIKFCSQKEPKLNILDVDNTVGTNVKLGRLLDEVLYQFLFEITKIGLEHASINDSLNTPNGSSHSHTILFESFSSDYYSLEFTITDK